MKTSERARKCSRCQRKIARVRLPDAKHSDEILEYGEESEIAAVCTTGGRYARLLRVWRLHGAPCVAEEHYRQLLRPVRRLPGERVKCPDCSAPCVRTTTATGETRTVELKPVGRLTFNGLGRPLILSVHRQHAKHCRLRQQKLPGVK